MANGKRVSMHGTLIETALAVAVTVAMAGITRGQTTQAAKEVALESVKKQIGDFKDQLSKETLTGLEGEQRSQSRREMSQLFTMLNTVSDALDESRYDDAVRSFENAPELVTTDTYRKEVASLTDALKKLAAADQASVGAQAPQLIKRVAEAIKTAKTPEDLAGLQSELQGATRRMNEGRMPVATRALVEQWRQPLAQATTTLSRYSELLGLEAAGDIDGASQIGSRLLADSSNGRNVPGREAIQQHMDALEKKRSESIQTEMQAMAKTVHDAKTSADLKTVQERLQSLSAKSSRLNGGTQTQRLFGDTQIVQTWGFMLDQESQKRYRTALNSLMELRQRETIDLRGNSGMLVTDEMITLKLTNLQKQIQDRGNDFLDPTLKPEADALTAAQTLEDLQKAGALVEANTTSPRMAADPDIQPQMVELQEAAGKIRALGEMRQAINTREWGRFWQLNQMSHNMDAAFGVMGNGDTHGNRWSAKIETQRMKLVREAVAESAEFKELKVIVQDDVPLDKTLLEAADVAIKAEDFRRAVLVMQAYVTFTYGSTPDFQGMAMVPAGIRADIQGLQLYAEGKSFETAGDLVAAVAAYRGVVRMTGPRVPLTQAMERLSALGKSNPDLLKQPMPEPRVGPADAH